MAFDNIEKPTEFLGVNVFSYSDGPARSPFDGAHAYGDRLWAKEMKDYQDALDPGGKFLFNSDARFNGCLVAVRKIDAAVLGTTAHGNHSNSVNELQWSSNKNEWIGFAQSNLDELIEELR